ncbi:unnamed protein product [Camellia sinensis]
MMVRYCLYNSMRIVNVIVNLFGVGIIIYSLWLLKKWNNGVSLLPSIRDLPRPWFIYVCLGIGIVVCLSTLSGHMVANCINKSTLAVYIVSIFSVLLIQVGVIVTILFRIDWESQIIKYIHGHYKEFKSFVLFHIVLCRLIAILVLVAQTSVVVLAAILWAVGGEPTIQSRNTDPLDITQSFLTDCDSPGSDDQRCLAEMMEGIFTRSFRQIRRSPS